MELPNVYRNNPAVVLAFGVRRHGVLVGNLLRFECLGGSLAFAP
mgnify:CR=1 FL=1